jgi:hypothetical protein
MQELPSLPVRAYLENVSRRVICLAYLIATKLSVPGVGLAAWRGSALHMSYGYLGSRLAMAPDPHLVE